jgi:hypothetical protein
MNGFRMTPMTDAVFAAQRQAMIEGACRVVSREYAEQLAVRADGYFGTAAYRPNAGAFVNAMIREKHRDENQGSARRFDLLALKGGMTMIGRVRLGIDP